MRNEYSTENGNKLILHTLPASQGWLVLRNAGEKLAAKISPNLHPPNSILPRSLSKLLLLLEKQNNFRSSALAECINRNSAQSVF